MAIDAYSPCPCDSGEKYKWCCQKAEPYAEKAARLMQHGQPDAAFKALEEGLRAVPDNPWLGLNKAMIQSRRGEEQAATETAGLLVKRHPKHAGLQSLYLQLMAGNEKPTTLAGLVQQALEAVPADRHAGLGRALVAVALRMAVARAIPAGLAHLELGRRLDPEIAARTTRERSMFEADPNLSLWLRNHYRVSPVPPGIDAARAERFAKAVAHVEAGLWAAAAREFDALSRLGTPESDRNLGLCRLWLADHVGAVEALRRYTSWIGPTAETVDLEVLCQEIDPPRQGETVERLQWIWQLRDRAGLLQKLEGDKRVVALGERPIHPEEPDSPVFEAFAVLDRPMPTAEEVISSQQVPIVQGTLLVGQELAVVEAYDDGQLDRLADWFREVSGTCIPPAHPRTKHVGRAPRYALALQLEWALPEGVAQDKVEPILAEKRRAHVVKVWPDLPMPALNGRTPRAAAGDKDALLPLQAALRLLDRGYGASEAGDHVSDSLRAELGLPPAPNFTLDGMDITRVHLSRYNELDIQALDDNQLIFVYRNSVRHALRGLIDRTSRALVERPEVMARDEGALAVEVYSMLATTSARVDDISDALRWIERGRQSGPAHRREAQAPHWDSLEVRLRAVTEEPEQWVPALAAVLDRYRNVPAAGDVVLSMLMSLDLVQAVRDPDQPDEVFLDTRALESLISRYGPRITTAGGELGVSASRPHIWTPGSEAPAAAPSGLWTPDQAAEAPQPEKSKLILP